MIYVYDKNNYIIELKDYEIYATCPICNDDVPLNLSTLLKNEGSSLDNVDVFCRQCSKDLGY